MKPLLVMVLLAAIAPPAPAAEVYVRSMPVEVAAGASAKVAKVDCDAGEHAVGGGFSLRSPELRVLASYPAGPSWVMEFSNASKVPVTVDLSASCLRGGEAVVVSSETDRVNCPSGTVIAGGGFQSRTGLVTSNYPSLSDSWVAEGSGVTRVLAVCVRGAELERTVTATVNAATGQPVCTSEPPVLSSCTWSRTGSQTLSCATGHLLTMGGQRVLSGTMPPYAVAAANSDSRLWTFRLAGSSREGTPLTIEVSAVCLRFAAPSPTAPPSRVDLSWPVIGGAGLLLVLLLAVAVAVVLRLRRRSSTGSASAQVEAVLTGQRTSLRYDSFREVP